jgi:hypothetical protein
MNPPDHPLEPNPGAIIEGAGLGVATTGPIQTVAPLVEFCRQTLLDVTKSLSRIRATRVLADPRTRLTTAEILYRLPDFPQLLQSLYSAGIGSGAPFPLRA